MKDFVICGAVIRPIVAWKARRRKKLIAAFAEQYGRRGTPADWMDFCEFEFERFKRGEISAKAYQ